MLSLFLLLLAISHRVLGGVQRKDTLHHDPSVNIPSQINLTKLSEHDNVTKDALDNDVQKEEIAKDIMKKVREILAAAQEDDVTDKPKSHIEIFMDLIDNMERPLESEVPNEDDLGNTDYTEYESEDYLYDYSDNDNDDKYYHYEDENKYFSNNNVLNIDSIESNDENALLEEDVQDTLNEVGNSARVTPTVKMNVAFPELLQDVMSLNEIPQKDHGKEAKHNLKKSQILRELPGNVRVKKRARSELNNAESNAEHLEGNLLINTEIEDEALMLNDTNKPSASANILEIPSEGLSNLLLEVPSDIEDELDDNLLVHTTAGSVYGQEVVISSGGRVKEYLSIPYAKPPTGQLRFKAPQPVLHWGKIINATVEHPRCWNSFASNSWEASDTGMSEDCLYLSIWAPWSSPVTGVILWLTSGREESMSGAELSGRGEVVVMRVESRRGALGYLATEDRLVTGNSGLQDQVMAMRWVHENIHSFGGDPGRVTLLGSGAGANLASLHLLSPLSCPLFNNIILQSGSPDSSILSLPEATTRATALSHLVGCRTENSKKMVECLRQVDPQVLINQELSVANYSLNMEPFPPTVDGVFLAGQPQDLLRARLYKKSSVLLGTNSNEGMDSMLEFLPDLGALELSSAQLDSAMARMFNSFSQPLRNLIQFQYGVFGDEGDNSVMDMKRFFGLQSTLADKEVVCKVDRLAKEVAEDGNKVFRYFFHPGVGDVFKPELSFVFGEPLQSLGRSQEGRDKDLSKMMIKYWADFNKHDDPNGKNNEKVVWPKSESPSWQYLKIGKNEERNLIGEDMRGRVCQFWDKIIPQFLPPVAATVPDFATSTTRPGRILDQTCGRVRQKDRMYFPG